MTRVWTIGVVLVLSAGLVWSLHSAAAQSEPNGTADPQISSDAGPNSGTRYTSPQFGYVVNWEAPWSLDRVESEPGQLDYLRVTTDEIYQVFIGIFTDATSEDAMRAVLHSFANTQRDRYPDLVIEQEWEPPADGPRQFMILLYTDASGVKKEVVDLVPVVPGKSAYIWIWGAPEKVTTCMLSPWAAGCDAVEVALTPNQVRVSLPPSTAVAAAEDLLSQLETSPFPDQEVPGGFVNAVVTRGEPNAETGMVGRVDIDPRLVFPRLQSSSQGITYRVYTTTEEARWAYQRHGSWLVQEERMVRTELADLSYPAALFSQAHTQLPGASSVCLVLVGNVVVGGSFTSLDTQATLLLADASAYNLALAGVAHLERIMAAGS